MTPDILYPSALEPGEYGESEEKNALPWDKVPVAQYSTLGNIAPELVNQLTTKHQQRISADVEFGYINADIAEFKKHHDDKTISLVESERIKSREDDDKLALDRTNERRVADGLEVVKTLDDIEDDKDAKIPDPFLDETALIMLDMVDAEKLAKAPTQ